MSQARYQNGSIALDKKTNTWLFRWREKAKGRVIRRSVTIGTKKQFPSREQRESLRLPSRCG